MNINEFSNCDCSPVSGGNCKQNGLLHWQILQEDYSKLPESYKNQGIVFFVKQKKEDKTGVIIRNNVVYSGGSGFGTVDGEKYQVLTSDGSGWIDNSDFIAKKIDFSYMDTLRELGEDQCVLDLRITVSPANKDNKIFSIKIKDETDGTNTEYIKNNMIEDLKRGIKDNSGISIGTVKLGKDVTIESQEGEEQEDNSNKIYVVDSSNNALYEIENSDSTTTYLLLKKYIKYTSKTIQINQILDKTHSYSLEVQYETNTNSSSNSYTYFSYTLNGQINISFSGQSVARAAQIDLEQEEIPANITRKEVFSFDNKVINSGSAMGVPNKSEELLFTNSPYFGTKDSSAGYLAIKDSGKVRAQDNSSSTFSGNSQVSIGENARFTMHDNAKMDITAGLGRENDGPEIYIHGNSKIYIDDGFNKAYYSTLTPKISYDVAVLNDDKDYEEFNQMDLENPDEEMIEKIKNKVTYASVGVTEDSSGSYLKKREEVEAFKKSKGLTEPETKKMSKSSRLNGYTYNYTELYPPVTVNKYYFKGHIIQEFIQGQIYTPPSNKAPHFQLSNSPFIHFKDNAYFTAQGDSYFVLQGKPNVVFGDSSYFHTQGSAIATFEESSQFHIMDAATAIFEESSWLDMKDNGHLTVQTNANVVFGGNEKGVGSTQVKVQDDTIIFINGGPGGSPILNVHGKMNVQFSSSGWSTDGLQFKVKDDCDFNISGKSYFTMQPSNYQSSSSIAPSFYMNAASTIIMNGNSNRGPALMLSPNQMIIASSAANDSYGSTIYDYALTGQYSYQEFNKSVEEMQKKEFNSMTEISRYYSDHEKSTVFSSGKSKFDRKYFTKSSTDCKQIEYGIRLDLIKDYLNYVKSQYRYTSEDDIPSSYKPTYFYMIKKQYVKDLYEKKKINSVFLSEEDLIVLKKTESDIDNKVDTCAYFENNTNYYENFLKSIGEQRIRYCPVVEIKGIKETLDYLREHNNSSLDYKFVFCDEENKIPYSADIPSSLSKPANSYFLEYYDRANSLELGFCGLFDKNSEGKYVLNSYGKSYFQISNYQPMALLCMGNDARVVMQGEQGSQQWIQVEGKKGEHLVVYLQNNSFIQHTGNSHEEVHDDSTIVLRGKIDTTKPPSLPKELTKRDRPWQDYYCEKTVEEESRRPIQPKDNGPLTSMYDNSTFFMRGKWNLDKDVNKAETVSFTLSENSSLRNDSEITMDKLKEDPDFKNWQQQTQQFYDADLEYTNSDFTGETNQVSINSATGEVTIQNYIFTTCPPNWSAEIPKREDSPLLEVSENAEVRIKGDIAIFADDSGITIKHKNLETEDLADSSDSVQFTFEELKKLKQYLTNVPTSDVILTDEETSKQYKLNVTNKKVNIEEINSTS